MWGAVLALVAAPSSGRAQSAGSGSAEDAAALPEAIPLFPLPDVTLFPGVDQQFHIFEPRYRAMVADAVEGDQVIGVVILRPGWEGDYEGNPPVFEIGGAGTIESYERLPDGRYDMVVRGFVKVRILSEDTSGPYRVARVEAIPETTIPDEDRARLSQERERLLELVYSIFPNAQLPAGLTDEVFVNHLAQFVPIDPADRQALLEEDSVLARSEALIDLLEAMRPTSQALAPGNPNRWGAIVLDGLSARAPPYDSARMSYWACHHGGSAMRLRDLHPRRHPRRALGAICTCAAATLAACSTDAGVPEAPDLRIQSLSTRPYLVTGGDVLLSVELGPEVVVEGVEILANGRDVTSHFRPVEGSGRLVGLVDGLHEGPNTVEARIPSGGAATLEVTNYPIWGPIISGPHESPFLCQTEDFTLATGSSLGAALDEHCSVETRVDYVYLPVSDTTFRPYSAGATDVARATTLDGETVPFIVRVETGTINRAIYQNAMLHDPADPTPDPWTLSRGWNGKLVYTHGGGCQRGWYRQGDGTGTILNEGLLEMGYAVTSASLNVYGSNCNDLLASETHIMVKERFVEAYGEPIYTIGTGGSGGSYQSHQTADNYPGVFDGIMVSSSFPDVTSATIFTLADARLLHHYFTNVAPGRFTREEERLVSGFGSWGSIANLSGRAARIDPTYEEGVPEEAQGAEVDMPELEPMRYSASNPEGIRATVYDHTVNVYGADPTTGFARRPLDNRGAQYGLAVLNRGEITEEQFLALNRDIGGFDADLNHVPERHRADPQAARRALDTGRILNGGAGLASTPVIDYRSYRDDREDGDIHLIVHQFTTRARLQKANGHADSHVMGIGGEWGYTEDEPDLGVLFHQMDEWLMNLVGGDDLGPRSERVVAAKPAGLVDHCWDTRGPERVKVIEPLSFEGRGTCGDLYRPFPTPRHVAGAPLTNDIVSCRLKPLDPSDYEVTFTPTEWAELEAMFPEGVCDWNQPDAHGEGYQGTWLSLGPSDVNPAR